MYIRGTSRRGTRAQWAHPRGGASGAANPLPIGHADCPLAYEYYPTAGPNTAERGSVPDSSRLSGVPTFTPSGGAPSGLEVLAAAAMADHTMPSSAAEDGLRALHRPGPYNPSAAVPPKVVKKLLALDFVEMSELRADFWPEDPSASDASTGPRRTGKPPVTTTRSWLECYSRMAAVLTSRFPEKAAELWAYQTTILHAAHTYEGANWVAYDRLYRREMLAAKNLNWSVPNQRLYGEAFMGRAKRNPQCPHCLSEDHAAAGCPHNPNPPIVGWFQGTPQIQFGPATSAQPGSMPPIKPTSQQEVCRNFNGNRCRFTRCRYLHICTDCLGPHRQPLSGRGAPGRSGTPAQPRLGRSHPYASGAKLGSDQQ